MIVMIAIGFYIGAYYAAQAAKDNAVFAIPMILCASMGTAILMAMRAV